MLIMNTAGSDWNLTYVFWWIEYSSLGSCLSEVILCERLLWWLGCCGAIQGFYRIEVLARRLEGANWTSPLVREGPLHTDCLRFDFDQSLLLLLLKRLLIRHLFRIWLLVSLIWLHWQSPSGLVRSLWLYGWVEVPILNQGHLLLLLSLVLRVVTLIMPDWQRLLLVHLLWEFGVHSHWRLLLIIELLCLSQEEAAFIRRWLLLLNSKLRPHGRPLLNGMINGHVLMVLLINVPVPCSALKPNGLKPLTEPLSLHLLQLDPHHFVLELQFFHLRDLASLVFQSWVLLFEHE